MRKLVAIGLTLLAIGASITYAAQDKLSPFEQKVETTTQKLITAADKSNVSVTELINLLQAKLNSASRRTQALINGIVRKLQGETVAPNITTNTTISQTTSISTKTAIENAQWDDNVSITFGTGTFTFASNGLPDSSYLGEQYLIPTNIASQPFSEGDDDSFTTVYSADYFKETTINTMISLFPKYSSTTTSTSLGQIGVVLNGAALFNDYENMELTLVALDDNVIHDHAAFVDECNGHSLQNGDSYHYHGVPTCITSKVDKTGQHSTMIGVLQDGFPVYGNKDTSGTIITNSSLDKCSGHFGATPEFPNGIYHYHLTADKAPYSVDCYHGEITASKTSMQPNGGKMIQGSGMMQGEPDLSAAATKLGTTEAKLKEALGTSRPPNFATAATKLGTTEAKLKEALGTPPM